MIVIMKVMRIKDEKEEIEIETILNHPHIELHLDVLHP